LTYAILQSIYEYMIILKVSELKILGDSEVAIESE
jgi:hypothetical protein